MTVKLIAILFLLLNAVCFAKAPSAVVFPSKVQGIHSPDRHYLIISRDNDGKELEHSLVLKDERSGSVRKILDYGRHVDVQWSLDSLAFYVNDYSGSDISNCLIVILPANDIIDSSALIKVQEGEVSAYLSSHHQYVTCKSWEKREVLVTLEGYGDEMLEGFERRYKINIKNKKIRMVVNRR